MIMDFLKRAWAWFLARKTWQKVLIVILGISVITAPFSEETNEVEIGSEPAISVSPTPSETQLAEPSESPSPTESVSETPIPLSPVEFRAYALGDLADMRKDVADAKKRINDGGFARLLGNVLELTFNVGQLQSITPSEDIAEEWNSKLAKLEAAVDKFSEGVGENSVSATRSDLDEILAAISTLEKFVKTVD